MIMAQENLLHVYIILVPLLLHSHFQIVEAQATNATDEDQSGNDTLSRSGSSRRTVFGFLQYDETCQYNDAWARFTLEEIIARPSDHCDPQKLLVCATVQFGLLKCRCGLVNARLVPSTRQCAPLARAPCNTVFNSDLDIDRASNCGPPMFRCGKTLSIINRDMQYDSCQCLNSNEMPDANGHCGGWKEAASSIQVSYFFVISTSTLGYFLNTSKSYRN